MSKAALIIGRESSLKEKLIQKCLRQNYKVLANIGMDTPKEGEGENCLYQPVARLTPLSARTLLLKALNTFDFISHAFLILSPLGISDPPHELSSADVEESVDAHLKGYLYSSKEILGYFIREGKGTLSFVSEKGLNEEHLIIDSVLQGAFSSLSESIFRFYRNEPIDLFGFSSDSTNYDDFSDYIVKIVENPGKQNYRRWNRFSERSGLFHSLTNFKR